MKRQHTVFLTKLLTLILTACISLTSCGSANKPSPSTTTTEYLQSEAADNTVGDTQKVLSKVNVYDQGDLTEEYRLFYDNDGLLRKAIWSHTSPSSGFPDPIAFTFTFTYDLCGRLLTSRISTFDVPTSELFYNGNGVLQREITCEGGMTDTEYQYDSQGNLICSVMDTGFSTETTEYFYNDSQQMIKTVSTNREYDSTYFSTEECIYTYDLQGRLATEVLSNSDYTIPASYSYDYPPFTVKQCNGSMMYLSLCDSNGRSVWSLYMGESQLSNNADGLLAHAEDISSGYQYDFIYDTITLSHEPESADINRSKYSAVLDAYRMVHMNPHKYTSDYVSDVFLWFLDPFTSGLNVYYAFHDLNGDGTEEMFVGMGTDAKYIDCVSVFTYSGGCARRIISDGDMGYRQHLTLFTDNTFSVSEDNGEEHYCLSYYTLQPNSDVAIKTACYGVAGNEYYHIDSQGNQVSITEDEFHEGTHRTDLIELELDWTML